MVKKRCWPWCAIIAIATLGVTFLPQRKVLPALRSATCQSSMVRRAVDPSDSESALEEGRIVRYEEDDMVALVVATQ
eukprot:symbB.v1.2.020268.t1/scaffold1670.1/size106578/3